ncbi:MAG: hypothetical protein HZA50_16925 [Planctomycetes bacterium]|nr:hypothetical protein [Planctomycetota bacterium]
MTYIALTFWLVLIALAGLGIYRLWSSLVGRTAVEWFILPGAIAGQTCYILGTLITGGDIKNARIIPGGPAAGGSPAPAGRGGLNIFRCVLASTLCLAGCLVAIAAAYKLLNSQLVGAFIFHVGLDGVRMPMQLPRELPASWGACWELLHRQIDMVRRMIDTLGTQRAGDWRMPLFAYLTICLGVWTAPVARPVWGALAAAGVLGGACAAAGAISRQAQAVLTGDDLWYLLTYLWAIMLAMLVFSAAAVGLLLAFKTLVPRHAPAAAPKPRPAE